MTPDAPPLRPAPRLARLPFFYGWVVVAVAFVTMGIGVNTRTAFSLLFPPILDEFGWDRATIAAAFSVGFVSSALYTPFIGTAMDRFGPRVVIPFGVLLVSAGLTLATAAKSPWQFYLSLGVLVVGGSVFVSYIGHSLFLPHWFVRRRGLATGIAFSGVGVGSILLFPWLQGLIGASGWRAACWAMAGLLLVVLLPLNIVLQRQRPEHLGLAPDGDPAAGGAQQAPADALNVVDPTWAAIEWTLARAVRTLRFWWLFAAFFSGLFVWYAIQVHQTKYLVEVGFAPELAAWALGLVGLGGIAGQIVIGHLSDRIGREWAWTIAAAGFVLCYLCLLGLQERPSATLVYLMVAAQGLLGYGLATVYGAIPAELFQGKHFGTIFGTLSSASILGAACGPWLTGWIYDRVGSYTPAFWLAIGLCLISIACIWLAAPRKVRAVAGQVARLQALRPPPGGPLSTASSARERSRK
jgi:MFS family permease